MPLPVQTASNSISTNPASSIAATFGSSVTAGDLIIVVCSVGINPTFSVSDNHGTVYAIDASPTQTVGAGQHTSTMVAHGVAGVSGTYTVTVGTGATGQDSDLHILEYACSSVSFDQTNSGQTSSTTTVSTGNVTTTQASELAVVVAYDFDAIRTFTVSSGWTKQVTTDNPDNETMTTADQQLTSIGTYQCTFGGFGSADRVLATIVTYKATFGPPPPTPPSISCASPPQAHVGQAYSHAFPASSGTPPYTNYAITAGSLPPGLTLNSSTGVVSGTPTTAGNYTFTIQVTDSTPLTGSTSCSINVNTNNAGPAFVGASAQGQIANPDGMASAQAFTSVGGTFYLAEVTIGSGGGGINGMGVFGSTDLSTWPEQDNLNAPTSTVGTVTTDTANNRFLFALATGTTSAAAIFLKPFNFGTATWGANFATGGPLAVAVPFVFIRPDTTIVAIYDFGASNPGGTSRLRATVWNGSVWSASIDLGTALLPFDASGNVAVTSAVAVMDSTGVIHIGYQNAAGTQFFYQQFLTNNTLGNSNHFTGLGISRWTSMAIFKNQPYISYTDTTFTNNSLQVGSNLSTPAWSTVTPPILVQPTGRVNFGGHLAAAGSLFWLINSLDPTLVYPIYQIASSADGQNWSLLPGNSTPPFFYDAVPGQSPQDANADFTFGTKYSPLYAIVNGPQTTLYGFTNVHNTVQGIFIGYILNSQTVGQPPPPPVVSNINSPGGGGDQIVHGGCKPLNEFDYCLLREFKKWNRIHPLPVCSVPEDLWSILPWEPEWGSLPALAVPFRKIQSIITPTTAAGDQVVSQLIVPQGYDGILAGIYWRYNGLNFIEGSGDIFWRVQVNQRFVKDLSNVGFTLGSSLSPLPMTDGQQLQSRQRISIVVNVPNLSGTIQIGTATITGGLFGFFWPKGVPGWTSR